MFEEIFITIGITGAIIASLFDIKTREVPDWLNFSLISIGLSFYLIISIMTKTYLPFLYSLLGFLAMFLLGSFLYYTKQWGGGDAKLLMGFGALFPVFQGSKLFLVYFLINLLLVGSLFGLSSVIYFGFKYKSKIKKIFKKRYNRKHFLNIIYILLALIVLSFFIPSSLKLILLLLIILFLFYFILIPFIKLIEQIAMFKIRKISQVTEGDWITKDIFYKGKLIYSKNSPGINKKQIELLKKTNLKSVIIKEGIAFTPAMLIALIMTLLFGNIFFNFF